MYITDSQEVCMRARNYVRNYCAIILSPPTDTQRTARVRCKLPSPLLNWTVRYAYTTLSSPAGEVLTADSAAPPSEVQSRSDSLSAAVFDISKYKPVTAVLSGGTRAIVPANRKQDMICTRDVLAMYRKATYAYMTYRSGKASTVATPPRREWNYTVIAHHNGSVCTCVFHIMYIRNKF